MTEETQSAIETKQVETITDKKESFSREYVQELREENKSWRLKAQEFQQTVDQIKSQSESEIQKSNELVSEAQKLANERIIRAELKASAIAAGMIDLDGLKLADLTSVKLNETGEVEGSDELMQNLKESKPYLFKEYKDSSSTAKIPSEKPSNQKTVLEMSKEEYQRAKRKLLGH